MTLYLIGLGLHTIKDVSNAALDVLKRCDHIVFESYTSLYRSTQEEIEATIGKSVMVGDRAYVEGKTDELITMAKTKHVALLVIGDPLIATTHTAFLLEAKQQGVQVGVFHNASVLNAVAQTGLEIYKFGRVISIPFATREVTAPIDHFRKNQQANLHTLFLLDLHPKDDRFMSTAQAIDYLLGHGVDENLLCVACGALATPEQKIVSGTLKELKNYELNVYPQCLIIPDKMHFVEEEMVKSFKLE